MEEKVFSLEERKYELEVKKLELKQTAQSSNVTSQGTLMSVIPPSLPPTLGSAQQANFGNVMPYGQTFPANAVMNPTMGQNIPTGNFNMEQGNMNPMNQGTPAYGTGFNG